VSDDHPELLEALDIDVEVRRRILAIFPRLTVLDHYELLNVERTADKKTVKRSYFEFAAVFHPDKYFRKELGGFKARMEAIFGRATQAYEVLSSQTARAEYDEYLGDLDRTRGLDSMLQTALQDIAAAESLAAEEVEAAATTTVPTSPMAARPAPPTPEQVAAFERARRDALAARLRGGRPSSAPRPGSSSAPPAEPKPDPGSALKRLHEERILAARRAQQNKYLAMATEAEKKGDVLSAARAYKVVLQEAGDDTALRDRAEDAIRKAEVALAETYLRQAVYEERSESWADAARSWVRVAKARPADSHAHERAAHALTRSNGDLHQAADLAKVAVAAEPTNANYKVTLANVYLAAGLTKNARRELEAAAQLSPGDGTIATLLKRVQKAG
jgi:curved DNA-binding protein CbpA